MPEHLIVASREVAEDLGLHTSWLNNGPSRGGYHIEDLTALSPTNCEIRAAVKWVTTHDVSYGFRLLLHRLLRDMGYEEID